MLEGLLITIVGMAVVFLVLTILMFVIMGLERLFRSTEVSGVAAEKVEEREVGEESVPENTVEVAAIALALASYLKERGKKLGTPIAIRGVQYQVKMEDPSCSPVTLTVNQDNYRAAVGEEGLPPAEQVSPAIVVQAKGTPSGFGWRSAYPPSQGGYWSRKGWVGKRSAKMKRE